MVECLVGRDVNPVREMEKASVVLCQVCFIFFI